MPNQRPIIDGKAVDWKTCMTMNENWGYSTTDKAFNEPNTVIRSVVHCASMNGNLLLNVGPDAMGKIPAESVEILAAVGEWFDKYAHPVYNTQASRLTPPVGYYYTATDEKTLYLHLVNPLMGDLILPELNGKVKCITVIADGSEVPLITFWGTELLKADELRIRPPKHLSVETIDVLKFELK